MSFLSKIAAKTLGFDIDDPNNRRDLANILKNGKVNDFNIIGDKGAVTFEIEGQRKGKLVTIYLLLNTESFVNGKETDAEVLSSFFKKPVKETAFLKRVSRYHLKCKG